MLFGPCVVELRQLVCRAKVGGEKEEEEEEAVDIQTWEKQRDSKKGRAASGFFSSW